MIEDNYGNKKNEVTTDTLSEIRKSIQKIDAQRADRSLTDEQRILLEETAIVLRDSERYAIQVLTKRIGTQLEEQLEPIRERSKDILSALRAFFACVIEERATLISVFLTTAVSINACRKASVKISLYENVPIDTPVVSMTAP